jgi:hypothetical protein
MKHNILFLCFFLFVFTLCAINPSYAADYTEGDDLWFSPDSGCGYNGVNNNKMDRIDIWSVSWNSNAISEFDGWDALELEFRSGTSGVQWRDLIDYGYESTYSELPGAYFENDSDDASFGCHDPHYLVANQNYEGYMDLYPQSSQPSSFQLIVECEWAKDYGYLYDPYPEDWEYLLINLNKGSGRYW